MSPRMQVGQFPASAANSLIEGYCDDFVALAVILAQTLEQVSMRGISLERSRPSLSRIENGMRELAEAIHEMIERGQVSSAFSSVLGKDPPAAPPPAPAPAAAAPAQAPAANQSQPMPSPRAPAARAEAPPSAAAPRAKPASPVSATRSPSPPPVQPPAAPTTPAAPARARADSVLVPVFRDLACKGRTGTLYVQIGDETLGFELASGCIQLTASDRPPAGERIGELLVAVGACSHERIAGAMAKADPGTGPSLGDRLVKAGVVSNAQLVAALEQQVRRRFVRACEAQRPSHEFVDGECLQGDGRICIAVSSLLPGRSPGTA
jgi:hypothetical protein